MSRLIMTAVRIENIRRATLNGKAVKLFDVRRLLGDAWVFGGQFSAPAKVANRDLLSNYLNPGEAELVDCFKSLLKD